MAGNETPEAAVDKAFAATVAQDARLRAPRPARRFDGWRLVPMFAALALAAFMSVSLGRAVIMLAVNLALAWSALRLMGERKVAGG